MALSVAKGILSAPSTTGAVSYTVGFQPKVVFLWHSGVSTTHGAITAGAHGGAGAISATAQWAHAYGSDDVVASSNAGQNFRTNACILIATSGTPTISGVAVFSAFTSTQFTLNWTTASATISNAQIHWLALGGTDLTNVAVGAANFATANGSASGPNVGFQPDALITCAAYHLNTGANAVDSHSALGFAANYSGAISQGAAQYFDNDANATMDCAISMSTSACLIANAAASSTTPITAALTAFTATGWTWTWSNVAATANMQYGYIALKGGTYKVVSETAATTNTTKVTSGVGFTPQAALMIATGQTATGTLMASMPSNTAQLAIGATAGANTGAAVQFQFDIHVNSQSKKSVTNVRGIFLARYTTASPTSTTVRETVGSKGDATITLQSDGWSAAWLNTDGTAWLYQTLVMADAPPAGPTGTLAASLPALTGAISGTVAAPSTDVTFINAATAGGASGTTLGFTLPAAPADDDIVVIGVFSYTGLGTPSISGFTLKDTRTIPGGGGFTVFSLRVFWRRASGDSATYSITFSGSAAYRAAVGGTYRNALLSGDPFDAVSGNAINPGDATVDLPTLTTLGDDRMLIGLAAHDTGSAYSSGTSPVTNERGDLGGITLYDGLKAATGATGTITLTNAGSGPWAGSLLALAPEPAAGGDLTGTMAGTIPALTGAIAGAVAVSGTMAGTLPALTGAVAAIHAPLTGTLAASLPSLTGAAAATVAVAGSINRPLPALTGAISGTVAVAGTLTGTLPQLTSTITGQVPRTGTLAAGLPALTGAFLGGNIITATLAASLPTLTGAVSGTVPITGSIARPLPALTGSIVGTVAVSGTLAGVLPALSGSVSAAAVRNASLAATLPQLTGAVAGSVAITGTLAGTLPNLTSNLTATIPITGTLAAALPKLTGLVNAGTQTQATLSAALPRLTGAGSGTVAVTGAMSGALPKLGSAFAGTIIIIGAEAGTLPALTGAFAGTVIVSGTMAGSLPALLFEGDVDTGATKPGKIGIGKRPGPSITITDAAGAGITATDGAGATITIAEVEL